MNLLDEIDKLCQQHNCLWSLNSDCEETGRLIIYYEWRIIGPRGFNNSSSHYATILEATKAMLAWMQLCISIQEALIAAAIKYEAISYNQIVQLLRLQITDPSQADKAVCELRSNTQDYRSLFYTQINEI